MHRVTQNNTHRRGREAKPWGCPRLTSAMSLLGLEGLSPLKSSLLPLSPLSASPSLICSDSDTDLGVRTPSWKDQSELGTAEYFNKPSLNTDSFKSQVAHITHKTFIHL